MEAHVDMLRVRVRDRLLRNLDRPLVVLVQGETRAQQLSALPVEAVSTPLPPEEMAMGLLAKANDC